MADLETVGKFASAGVTARSAGELLAAIKVMADNKVSIQQTVQLVRDVIGAGMSVQSLVAVVSEVKASSIPIEELGRVSEYKKSLDKLGIDSAMLGKLVETIKTQGNLDNTIALVHEVGQLENWKEQIWGIEKTKEDAQKSLTALKKEITAAEERKKGIQDQLDLYQKQENKGFNEELLVRILESAQKYGDPSQVIAAVHSFGSVLRIFEQEKQTSLKLQQVQADLTKLQAEYQSYANAIQMCEFLMKKKFSMSILERIYDAAKQYGEPLEVLKAIDRFGKMPEMETALTQSKGENEIAKLKIAGMESRLMDYEEIKHERDELLKKSSKVDESATMIIQELGQELEKPPNFRSYRKELVDSGLPEKLEVILEHEVGKRIATAQNNKLIATFQAEMKRQVRAYLSSWPSTPKRIVDELNQKTIANPFAALQGEWSIPCTRCGKNYVHVLTLDSYNIVQLLVGNVLEVRPSLLMAGIVGRHTVNVSLADIVKQYLDHEPYRG